MAHENLHLQVEVEIDGTQLSNVSNLVLDQKLDWHHTFELRSPLDAIEGERAISLNSSQNFVGKEIKIVLKSQTGSAQLNLFKGIVTSVNLSRHGGAAADLVIKGHSSSILLDDGPGCSTHLEKSIKQIVQTATAQYPVNMISVKNSPSPDPMLHYHAQYNESTYNFLARLANTHGQWFFYNGVEMIFGKPEGASPIELNFGHDLASFDLSMKVMPLLFEANGYEYVQQATLKKSSDRSIEGQNPLG
ncbi:MAG: contractile injection system protein, VgrG/Pvc8 family, partial [Flavobacteriales bacterium]